MRHYKNTNCSKDKRSGCFNYPNIHCDSPKKVTDPCWTHKNTSLQNGSGKTAKECIECPYFQKQNSSTVKVTTRDDGIVIISCTGVLNNLNATTLETTIKKLEPLIQNRIVLDLSGVKNIYSVAIGQIVNLHMKCRDFGGRLIISGASGYLLNMLSISKLDRILLLAQTTEDALIFLSTEL
ncbi:STAS domain-containing protein [Chitinispirillales bacterium ANBcel5]|uniref:STAS domain-containing protein n=1 Tax=Cellulosispirillum alkaliphilum TaxID=3039283 RepID=UPI002A55D44C|nr:STAS domain-containing protein [Chitinispirillales bacterium ANBcel5]